MRLLVKIRRATLEELWSRETGTVKGKLTMVNMLGKVEGDELGLNTWITPLGTFPIVYEVGMILPCTNLRFSSRKGRHAEHLQ